MTDRLGPYLLGPNDTPENGIYTGDARELAVAIPDESVDFALWDPDYGMGMDYGDGALSPLAAIMLAEDLAREMRRMSRNGQSVMFWSGSVRRIEALLSSRLPDIWPVHYMGVWYKPNGAGPSGNGFGRRFETWFWLKDGPKPPSEWRFLPDVLVVNRVVPGHREAVAHPSQKPVALLSQLMRFFTLPGDVVVDPCCGSGSTAVAAKGLGRRWWCCDVNESYVEIARQRVRETQPLLPGINAEQGEFWRNP